MIHQIYTEDKYLQENPAWHIEDYPWKAGQIMRMSVKNMLKPKTILKNIKLKSGYKIFHILLDISIQSVLRLTPISNLRRSVGHIHYFTKKTALEALKDSRYKIVDYFYTAGYIDLPAKSLGNHIARIPRQLLYSIPQDLAVRIMGGYSLTISAK